MDNQTPNFKKIQNVHIYMCIAPAPFLAICIYLQQGKEDSIAVLGSHPLYYITPLAAILAVFIGRSTFKKQLALIDPNSPLFEKLLKYQSSLLSRLAFTEAAALFNAVAYFLLGHYVFAIVVLLLILLMLTFRPTKLKVAEDLQLNYTDLN